MAVAPAAELPPPRQPGTPYRVCLVCLGNICRSPMAESVLRAELAAAGLDGLVVVDSAGTGDWHVGDGMDPDARAALATRGHDGSAHRARQFQPSWLSQRDLILAMDRRNRADLRRMAQGGDQDRIRLFTEVGELTKSQGGDIPDPWGGGPDEFGHVLDLLRAAAPVIAGRLAQLLRPGTGPGDVRPGTGPGDVRPGTGPGDARPGTAPGDARPGTAPGDDARRRTR